MRYEFAPDDEVDSLALDMVEKLFGVEVVFLSNETPLEHFMPEREIPGHPLTRFADIPLDDQSNYKVPTANFDPQTYYVWYPDVSKEEWARISQEDRRELIKRLEETYQISMADFKGPLYVTKIARFILKEKVKQLKISSGSKNI
jgi:hypothetical protein